MKKVDILLASNIQHLSIKVSSKISAKYLKDFFKTQFELHSIIYDDTDMVYYNFIESLNIYEILLFKTISKNTIIEPLLPLYFKKDGVNIFIFNHFFVVFKDNSFFAYKSIENETNEDIVLYTEQTYDIKIDNTIEINQELYNQLLDNKPIKIKYLKLNNNIDFNIFIMFILIISGICFYIFNLKKDITIPTPQNNLYDKLQIIYKQHNPNISVNLIEFLKYLKLFKIQIEKLTYNKNSLTTILLQKDKSKFYDLFAKYKKVKIKSIVYDKDKQLYKMDIKIEF